MDIKVVEIKDAGYYSDEIASGNAVKVTLRRGNEFASCDSIVLWDEELVGSALFDEWVGYAKAGIAGCEYWQA